MLSRENTGLIVVDIQGKLARLVYNSDSFIACCQKLVQGAKTLGLPIVWLEQNPEGLGATVEELHSVMAEQEPVIKFTFDACKEPRFLQAIQKTNRKTWLVCGIEAHICVYQTVFHLKNLNYDVHLVCDCISSRKQENIELAANKLVHHGVSITGLEMCLYELVQDCRFPEFKEILNLIK
ncbi:MAG: isochorismatase family protein [Desulfobulbaceae bacterium]|nr:isochorismatase family protein [Desulfobulbaceae bacterium]